MVGRLRKSRSKATPADQTEDGRYRVVTAAERDIAKRLKAAFLATRAYYSGASTPVSKKSDKIFLAAVKPCMDSGDSPEEFAAKQLKEAHKAGCPLFPQVLCCKKFMLRHMLAAEDETEESLAYYTSQLDLLRSRSIILSTLPADVLLSDPHTLFSPLFRYCMAIRLGFDKLADRYRAEARIELRLRPIAGQMFQSEASTLQGGTGV